MQPVCVALDLEIHTVIVLRWKPEGEVKCSHYMGMGVFVISVVAKSLS